MMLKRNLKSMAMSLVEVLIGILLLINPVAFTSSIIIAFGVVLMTIGVIDLVKYFYNTPEKAAISQFLSRGLLALLAGVVCVFYSDWFVVTFPVLTMVYGVVILISGVVKLQWTVDMIRLKRSRWFWVAISAALSVICGITIVANPFSSTAILWMFIGISLIVEAVFDMIGCVFGNRETQEASHDA